jgi:hypothetical protein
LKLDFGDVLKKQILAGFGRDLKIGVVTELLVDEDKVKKERIGYRGNLNSENHQTIFVSVIPATTLRALTQVIFGLGQKEKICLMPIKREE